MIKRMVRSAVLIGTVLLAAFGINGCGIGWTAPEAANSEETDAGQETSGASEDNKTVSDRTFDDKATGADGESAETIAGQVQFLDFVDVLGNEYQVELRQDWEMHSYEPDGFVHEGDALYYSSEGDDLTSRMGVDVSHYQGSIDWESVKAAGYDFAFVRIGFRGYGSSGTLNADKRYRENLTGALEAGLDVGVYFFSQAVSEEEAAEEAEYVLYLLEEADISIDSLTLPIVFDPESILGAEARTDDVTGEQFTQNAIAFCERIREAGAQPMIYCNMLWEAYQLDLGELREYPIWYADYEETPQTPYAFTFWQYSESAHVDGIPGEVDTDIWLIP